MAIGPQSSLAILANWFGGSRGPITFSLHTGTPGDTGANEATGGSYLPQVSTWITNADGATQASRVTFRGLAAGTYSYVGIRVGGVWWDSVALPSAITVGAGGTIEIPPGRIRVAGATSDEVPTSPMMIVPEYRRTTWDPGIPGGIPTIRQVHTTLTSAHLTLNGTGDNTAVINAAIVAAGAQYLATGVIQEVVLPVGTIRITNRILLNRSGVVLRGQGWNTRIRLDMDGLDHIIAISAQRTFFWGSGTGKGPWNLTSDGVKGSNQITVSNSSANSIQVGDVLCLDVEDTPEIIAGRVGGWVFDKRQTYEADQGPALRAGGEYRSITTMIEVTAKTVGATDTTLTLRDPLHMDFPLMASDGVTGLYPQVWQLATEYTAARSNLDGVHWVGVEDLYVTGGGIQLNRAAYSWILNCEVDGHLGTPNIGTYTYMAGCRDVSIKLNQCYRCVVRSNYLHHKHRINQNSGGYLLTLYTYTSECLVEDNIVVYGNKGIMGNMCGGGNVIAYNFVDNVSTGASGTPGGWQEGAIDVSHRSYPHSALVEGNDTVNLTVDTTHGTAGFHAFFRNYSRGVNSNALHGTYPWDGPVADNGFRRAAGVDGYHAESTFIGNVLFADPSGTQVYQLDHTSGFSNAAPVWRIGQAWGGDGGHRDDGTALEKLYRHMNWDSVTNGIADLDATNAVPLPDSLYLSAKPDWYGSAVWPPVDPNGATAGDRYHTIPAKVRYDAILGD